MKYCEYLLSLFKLTMREKDIVYFKTGKWYNIMTNNFLATHKNQIIIPILLKLRSIKQYIFSYAKVLIIILFFVVFTTNIFYGRNNLSYLAYIVLSSFKYSTPRRLIFDEKSAVAEWVLGLSRIICQSEGQGDVSQKT